ncbi:MAG: CHAD domain-containing protein [Porticoccaceae bacterium]
MAHLLEAYLRQGKKAARRLDGQNRADALHALRVALRRSRALISAYPEWLPAHCRKNRKRLRRLMALTNTSRDNDVTLVWLESLPANVQSTAVFAALSRHLREPLPDAGNAKLRKRFTKLRRRLRKGLPLDLSDNTPFGLVAQEKIQTSLAIFSSLVDALRSHPDETLCHEARIAGKRLRYLLEPLCHSKPLKRRIIAPLTTIQDLLGEIQDCHMATITLATTTTALYGEPAGAPFREDGQSPRDSVEGLQDIANLLAERRRSAWQNLRRNLNGDDNLFETLLVELESPGSVGIYAATYTR